MAANLSLCELDQLHPLKLVELQSTDPAGGSASRRLDLLECSPFGGDAANLLVVGLPSGSLEGG